jgi:hypothetical protein
MTTRQQVAADQNSAMRLVFKPSRLAMFLSEVQSQPPLDSRLEHAGMTDFGFAIFFRRSKLWGMNPWRFNGATMTTINMPRLTRAESTA